MITTFDFLVKDNGFETFKKYDVDKWIGDFDDQYHIRALMVMDDGTMCLWYDDKYARDFSNKKMIKKTISTYILDCQNKTEVIWADTEEEMDDDYKLMKEKKDVEDNHTINNCLAKMKEFCRLYDKIDWRLRSKVDKAIKDNAVGLYDVIADNVSKWYEDNDCINDDDEWEIHNIHRSHCVKFNDKHNKNIMTTINLDSIQVIYNCLHNDKKCLRIKTRLGEDYYIYKEGNTVEYKSLCVLYGYNI